MKVSKDAENPSPLKKTLQGKAAKKKSQGEKVHQVVDTLISNQMEETIQEHRSTVLGCQTEQTALTNQLTETVSKIDEIEIKMEELRKELEVSGEKHSAWLVLFLSCI